MIVAARMKADRDQTTTLAWRIENFGRMGKNLKDLDHYLNPPTPAQKKRGLLDMFKRVRHKQEGA